MNGVECYIRECRDLVDPLEDSETFSSLSEARQEKIRKYKAVEDRKRGACAGLLIAERLKAHGHSPDEIVLDAHGRPRIDGLDFNISHAGDYVIMAVSDSSVGCDIERLRDRKSAIAKRFYSESEKEWMEGEKDRLVAFYRIWTARESYVKYTGEGISLDFQRYDVQFSKESSETLSLKGDLKDVFYLGSAKVMRDGALQDCRIHQWRYDHEYVISVCISWETKH